MSAAVVLPCPFCGAPAERTKDERAAFCAAHTAFVPVEEWNRRADPMGVLIEATEQALVEIAEPRIKDGRCRWCRSRSLHGHSPSCSTVIATAALRGVPPKETIPTRAPRALAAEGDTV